MTPSDARFSETKLTVSRTPWVKVWNVPLGLYLPDTKNRKSGEIGHPRPCQLIPNLSFFLEILFAAKNGVNFSSIISFNGFWNGPRATCGCQNLKIKIVLETGAQGISKNVSCKKLSDLNIGAFFAAISDVA